MGFDAQKIMQILSTDPSQLSNNELLQLILKPFVADYETVAFNLLKKFITLEGVYTADPELLMSVEGMTEEAVCMLKAVHVTAFNLLDANMPTKKLTVFTKETGRDLFKPHFLGKTVEEMYLMLLDSSCNILCVKLVAKGKLDHLNIDTKYIIELACKYNASKAVVAHNHTTGPAPSAHDVIFTSKLVWLFAHMGIELCDHYIFYKNKCHSMVESGEMTPLSYNLTLSRDI